MSLFNKDDLTQIFPEAVPECLTNSNVARYENIASSYLDRQESLGRMVLTGGNHDPIGDLIKDKFNNVNIFNGHDLSYEFKKRAITSIKENEILLTQTFGRRPKDVFNNRDHYLANVNWENLELVYNYYFDYGLMPKILLTHSGHSDFFYETMFESVREFQITNHDYTSPDFPFLRGKKCLIIDKKIKDDWVDITKDYLKGWDISVISNTENPFETNVWWTGRNEEMKITNKINQILDIQKMIYYPEFKKIMLPTIEQYLNLQAIRLMQGQMPLDSKGSSSWLSGKFAALGYSFLPGHGLYISSYAGSRVNYSLGIRPIIGDGS